MKIVIAPDAYKGSLLASEVAIAIEQGFLHALPNATFVRAPMGDGGEGTLECLLEGGVGDLHFAEVTGPAQEKVKAAFGILKDKTAVIEMAKASGLSLVPTHLRNPLKSSTVGTGELIRQALDLGCQRFIIGLGGSATCDGGIGALGALGFQFKDAQGEEIPHTGEGLLKLAQIDTTQSDERLSACEFIIAHDVDNPLLGLKGALMYAPQKGATPEQVEILHKALETFSLIITKTTQKNIGDTKGTGAAGGMGAGFLAFLNSTLKPGAPFVIDFLKLREKIEGSNLIVTGEGQIDFQTIQGKTPVAVAKLAKEFNIPVIAIAAILGRGYYEVYDHGIDAVFSIVNGPISESICMAYTKPLLAAAANNIARLLKLGIKG